MMYQSKRDASCARPKDIPGRTTMMTLVKERARVIEEELAKHLKVSAGCYSNMMLLIYVSQDVPGRVSLTFDSWTSAIMTTYIAVMVHYIDEQWQLVTELLSFAELPGSHSGENMGTHLFNILKDFDIIDKVS